MLYLCGGKGPKETWFHREYAVAVCCHLFLKIKNDLHHHLFVCVCVCVLPDCVWETKRKDRCAVSHMWLQSVFLLVLSHLLPFRMTSDCCKRVQGLSKHDSSRTLSSLLQQQIVIWGTFWPKDRLLLEHSGYDASVSVCPCVCVRTRCGVVLTDGPVNTPRVSDITVVALDPDLAVPALFIWLSGIEWNPQLSHTNTCVPPQSKRAVIAL